VMVLLEFNKGLVQAVKVLVTAARVFTKAVRVVVAVQIFSCRP
jgi:hypothetical protein